MSNIDVLLETIRSRSRDRTVIPAGAFAPSHKTTMLVLGMRTCPENYALTQARMHIGITVLEMAVSMQQRARTRRTLLVQQGMFEREPKELLHERWERVVRRQAYVQVAEEFVVWASAGGQGREVHGLQFELTRGHRLWVSKRKK